MDEILTSLHSIPENPLMSDLITHGVSILLLALLNCSNTVLVRGVYIDAEEPDGQCVVFPVYYIRLFFQKERLKKQRMMDMERGCTGHNCHQNHSLRQQLLRHNDKPAIIVVPMGKIPSSSHVRLSGGSGGHHEHHQHPLALSNSQHHHMNHTTTSAAVSSDEEWRANTSVSRQSIREDLEEAPGEETIMTTVEEGEEEGKEDQIDERESEQRSMDNNNYTDQKRRSSEPSEVRG